MNKKSIWFLLHGIVNLLIQVPALFATACWAMLMVGVFELWTATALWEILLTVFPLLLPPLSFLVGIVGGIVYYRRVRFASFCAWASLCGALLYAGMLAVLCYLGSIA